MGVVKYVGRADFAAGIWLGLELRNPRGNFYPHLSNHSRKFDLSRDLVKGYVIY